MQALETQIKIDEWRGLYKESWKGLISDEAFAHPAKFSRALIQRIYDHVIEEGWASKGNSVVDPFGGVALGAFPAMQHGLMWYGCELEEKFVTLGNQNIALWNERYSRMPNWGSARLLQGDSSKLIEVLSAADCCVSSPPYASGEKGHPSLGSVNKDEWGKDGRDITRRRGLTGEYGASTGQLAEMKEGDHGLVVSSPPYVAISPEKSSKSVDYRKQYETYRSQGGGASFEKFVATQELHSQGYGKSAGQLSAMSAGSFDAAVSSPPWEKGAEGVLRKAKFKDPEAFAVEMAKRSKTNGSHGASAEAYLAQIERDAGKTYGNSDGQLGQQSGETFWSASRLILEQLHQVIVPGGHAVFVVKAFVRNKQVVDFPGQWAQLCEAVGFRLLHDHHALLTEHYGTQCGFDEDKRLTVERKSFFRRLAESKGSPRIDHENVLCFERR